MRLDGFLTEARQDLERFEAHWKLMHKQEPSQYPLELPAGEWHEQFQFFLMSGLAS